MTEESKYEEQPREHSEQPAEGDRSRDPSDTGTHAQDPAEGAEPDSEMPGTSGQD